MEHETEYLIRLKVRKAEALPVAWKKDLVWHQVVRPTARKAKTIFYYIAAGILIAGFSALYVLQVYQQTLTTSRIHELELSVRNKGHEQQKSLVKSADPQLDACIATHRVGSIQKRNHEATTGRLQDKSPVSHVDLSPKVEAISSEIMLAPPDPDTSSETVATSGEPQITAPVKAIIGYIPLQKDVKMASGRIKKSRIRFLKSPEIEPNYQTAETKWITARIN